MNLESNHFTMNLTEIYNAVKSGEMSYNRFIYHTTNYFIPVVSNTQNKALNEFFDRFCKRFEIDPNTIRSKTRFGDLVFFRTLFMATARHAGFGSSNIANIVGCKRTNVINMSRMFVDECNFDKHKRKYFDIAKEIVVNTLDK